MKSSKTKFFIMAVLTVFAMTGIVACGGDKSVDSTLAQIAIEANKDLPMMIDAQTRLDKITTLPGKKIQYNNTLINASNEGINMEAFKEGVGRTLLATVKTNPGLESFRKKNVTFIYHYQDKDGNETAVFEYAPEAYK